MVKFTRNRNLIILLLGKLISALGTQIQDFAMSLYVLKITGSATQFASVLAATVLPNIILGPICGVFADWFDKKKLMIVLNFLNGVIVASMGIIYVSYGRLPMWYIYFSVVSLSIVSILYSSSSSAVIPLIVEKEELLEANSLNATVTAIPAIAGPIISGIIYGFFGIFDVLLINSLSFFIFAIMQLFLHIPKISKVRTSLNLRSFAEDFKEGLVFIKEKKIILKIVIAAFAINFALEPVFSLGFNYIAKKILFISDAELGSANSIFAIASLLAPIIVGIIGGRVKAEKAFGYAMSSVGIVIALMSAVLFIFSKDIIKSSNIIFIIIIIEVFITVLLCEGTNIFISSMFQSETPVELLGRAGSVLGSISLAAVPLGQMLMGTLMDCIPIYFPIMFSAVVIFLCGMMFIKTGGKEKSKITESVS